MRAMAVTAYGEPLAPIDVTEPDVPDGHALLAVEACGVCSSDLKTARGLMPFSDDLVLPHVPGHEIAGRVLGTNPPGLLPDGALVAVFHYWPCGRCAACRRGDETLCSALDAWVGFTDPGGFQQRLAVPVDRLVPIPDGIGAAHAAPMTCALGTAYRAVVTRGRVDAGTRVVVIGLGGVGIHAAQIAVAAGAQVTGVDRHAASAALAADLGLDVHRDAGVAKQALLDATSGEGFDVVIDTVGHADTLSLAADMTREGGRVVGVGYSPSEQLRVATPRFVLGELTFVGSRFAHRDELERAVRLVVAGRVRPIVGLVRPLDEINEVFEALEAGLVVGRAVVDVSGALQHTPSGHDAVVAGG